VANRTVGDCVTQARTLLNDSDGTRYSDADLIGYINDAVQEARALRPDLFLPNVGTDPADVAALSAAFPLPNMYFRATYEWITAMAELRDDQFSVDGRAAMLLGQLPRKLVQGV
jgi:hypothetical protein